MLPFVEVGEERFLEDEEEPLIATVATPSLSE
jgi:hypothetical protein